MGPDTGLRRTGEGRASSRARTAASGTSRTLTTIHRDIGPIPDEPTREAENRDRKAVVDLIDSEKPNLVGAVKKESDREYSGKLAKFVYEDEKGIEGYMVLRRWGGVLWLDLLVVHSEADRHEVQKALIDRAKEACQTRGLPQITAATRWYETGTFSEKQGFEPIGALEGPFQPLDAERKYFRWRAPG